jgi:hypothetical protein
MERHGCYLAAYLLATQSETPADDSTAHPDLVLGYRLASAFVSVAPGTSTGVSDTFQVLCQNLGLPWTKLDAEKVLRLDASSLARPQQVMRQWQAFEAVSAAWAGSSENEIAAAQEILRQINPTLLTAVKRLRGHKDPVSARVNLSERVPNCNECGSGVSTQLRQLLHSDLLAVAACEACGRILVPINTQSSVAQAAIGLLDGVANGS